MSNTEFTKKFDLEHAKEGAPYGLKDGSIVRIIVWDRLDAHPIMGLKLSAKSEFLISWDVLGNYGTNPHGSASDLVMLPLFILEGKPVFTGDLLINKYLNTPCAAKPYFKSEPNGYTWPTNDFVFEGKILTRNSILWHKTRIGYKIIWDTVHSSSLWNGVESHFDYLVKAYTHNGNYSWSNPTKVYIDTKRVVIGDIVYINNERVTIDTELFASMQKSPSLAYKYTLSKPKVKKEVWQPRIYVLNGLGEIKNREASMFSSKTYESEKLCIAYWRADPRFIKAELVSTYYE